MPTKKDPAIPEEFADRGPAWDKWFLHAFHKGCSEKASIIFAEAHYNDAEELPNDPAVLKRRIAELEAQVGNQK